jgi:hypothetical protein
MARDASIATWLAIKWSQMSFPRLKNDILSGILSHTL